MSTFDEKSHIYSELCECKDCSEVKQRKNLHDKSFIVVIERMIEQKLIKIKNADLAKSTGSIKEDLAAYEALQEVKEAFKTYG